MAKITLHKLRYYKRCGACDERQADYAVINGRGRRRDNLCKECIMEELPLIFKRYNLSKWQNLKKIISRGDTTTAINP